MKYIIIRRGKNFITKHIDCFGKIWLQKLVFLSTLTTTEPIQKPDLEKLATLL